MRDKKEKISTATQQPTGPMVSKFSAIDKVVVSNLVDNDEKENKGQPWIRWGTGNAYPNYVYDLYRSVPTLQSIINGTIDFVSGDGVFSRVMQLSDSKARQLVRNIAKDILIFGGSALNVLRSYEGGIGAVVPVDMRKIRSDKSNTVFYYSDEFGEKLSTWGFSRGKYIESPKFNGSSKQKSSIYFYKGEADGVYPVPIYAAAAVACEMEKKISEYGLNSIDNGFASNFIISFCNGVPTDAVKEEIEQAIYEKYTGSENASRPLISYCMDKEHSLEVAKIDADNFMDRWTASSTRARQDIFTAFRGYPALFGIVTENLGFSSEEFANSFKLYNKTVVKPMQTTIKDILADIFGQEAVDIEEFTINFD